MPLYHRRAFQTKAKERGEKASKNTFKVIYINQFNQMIELS